MRKDESPGYHFILRKSDLIASVLRNLFIYSNNTVSKSITDIHNEILTLRRYREFVSFTPYKLQNELIYTYRFGKMVKPVIEGVRGGVRL